MQLWQAIERQQQGEYGRRGAVGSLNRWVVQSGEQGLGGFIQPIFFA
jgi:hypothetical protein